MSNALCVNAKVLFCLSMNHATAFYKALIRINEFLLRILYNIFGFNIACLYTNIFLKIVRVLNKNLNLNFFLIFFLNRYGFLQKLKFQFKMNKNIF